MKNDICKFIMKNMPFPMWIEDLEETIIGVNEAYAIIHNKNIDYFTNRKYNEIYDKDKYVKHRKLINEVIDTKSLRRFEVVNEYICSECYVMPYFDDYDNILGVFGVFVDITESKSKQKELENQKNILRTIIDTLPDFIFFKDRDSKYVGYNKKWDDYYKNKGFNNMIGKTDLEIGLPKELALSFIKKDKEIMKTKRSQFIETIITTEMGEKRTEESIKVPVINEDGDVWGIVGVARDVTERKKIEDKLRTLSYKDVLTGLNNRTYFEEKIKEINQEKFLPIGVIMGDVNGLKVVNDTFGHLEGDRLLKTISQIIKDVSGNSSYVFRWGGDEFVILIQNYDEDGCEKIIEDILNKCDNYNFDLIQLSISLGASIKRTIDEDIYSNLKEAEEKVYRQKLLREKSVRSSVVFSLQQSLEEKNMETEQHTLRLLNYAKIIGKKLGMTIAELDELELVTKLHDIGKIGISEDILLKPSKLTKKEFDIMKTHTEKGYRILQSSSELAHVARGVLTHHERWDGKGYPLGLKDKEIPLVARIVSVVDSFDAMTNDRVYSKAKTKKEALEELRRCSGSQFDPEIVDIFIKMIQK